MGFKDECRKAMRQFDYSNRLLSNYQDIQVKGQYLREKGDLRWKLGPRAPLACVEAGRAQIHDRLYLFGGYRTLDCVSTTFHVLDLENDTWISEGELPPGAAHTHQGITTDDQRYIYLISGQLGANCSPCTRSCYVFDSEAHCFDKLPPLPEGRYTPVVHYHQGRLHCLSGSSTDRVSPSHDHWSLPVDNGKALQLDWDHEPKLPVCRTHTSSWSGDGGVYLFGGQQGDVPVFPESSNFICNFDSPMDEVFDTTFFYDLQTHELRTLNSAPSKFSHSERATLRVGRSVIIAGGCSDRKTLTDLVLRFDLVSESWSIVGHLPYPMKANVAAYHNGWLYTITGQRCFSPKDPRPGEVIDSVWKTKLTIV